MIFEKKPNKFNPFFEVVSCVFNHKDEILLLKRSNKVEFAGTYGAPTGKVENNEPLIKAMIREIKEETGLSINETEPRFIKTFYVRYPQYDFIYHLFSLQFTQKPVIKLNSREHVNYKWVKREATLNMPLVPDMQPCLNFFNKWQTEKIKD